MSRGIHSIAKENLKSKKSETFTQYRDNRGGMYFFTRESHIKIGGLSHGKSYRTQGKDAFWEPNRDEVQRFQAEISHVIKTV